MANEDFDQALIEAQQRWMDEGGVVAVGQGDEGGAPTIDVWASGELESVLPETLHGFKVRIRSSGGPIQAQ
ncbi:MAG: hypothetical protein GEU78_02495 [Actinobacteria bacterium]|nr:hypothetical protein [Actinomycetota bacterium]